MSIATNLATVQAEITAACLSTGRASDAASLLVVSKTFPVPALAAAAACGIRAFGESRAQEALDKISQLPDHLQWHFIGHLQTNKVRKLLSHLKAIHSVDSLDLAQCIDRIASELNLRPQAYLQVNVAGDAAKFGFTPAEVTRHFDTLLTLPHLDIIGLMTIPFAVENPEAARPHFAALRHLRDKLEQAAGRALPGLSMGMSEDFPIAIAEGSTIVRVGSRIFGGR